MGAGGIAAFPVPASAATLPDGRAYEWVSPTLDGAAVSGNPTLGAVTDSGNGVAFQTLDAPAGSTGSPVVSAVLASRSAAGWQDTSLTPPSLQPELGYQTVGGIDAVSDDQSQAVLATDQPLVAGAAAGVNLYLRRADGSYALLTDAAAGTVPIPGFTFLSGPGFAGVSADFTHVFFTPAVPQLPQDPVGANNLYQWADGQLSLVNVLPDGTYATDPAVLAANALPAVSADGNEVLFQELGTGLSPLYLRIGGDHTVQVDVAQRAVPDPNGTTDPTPVGITADGSAVLFLSHSQLTDDSSVPDTDLGQDLYRYDVGSGALSDLTPDANPADAGTGANVQSVVGASPDGDYVYFTATGGLAAGGVSGQLNLYVEHAGTVTYVADAGGLVSSSEFYVTPNGEHAAFVSTGNLTAYDATDASTGNPDSEVYNYDAATGRPTCVSCRPDGTRPAANASLPRGYTASDPATVVSDDGRRVFFQSADAVLPGASNGLQNVYEWEASGAGSCVQAGGCVFLISPGTGGSPADLLASSRSGDDVIFKSYDALVPEDQTHKSALFDARVGGGFPGPAPAAPGCDSSGTCQGTPGAPAPEAPAATVSFFGPGNSVPAASRPAHVTVSKNSVRSVSGSTFVLHVKVPAGGRVTISGAHIAKRVLNPDRAETLAAVLHLTARAKAQLRRAHSLKVGVKIAYRPVSGAGSSASLTVPLRTRGGRS